MNNQYHRTHENAEHRATAPSVKSEMMLACIFIGRIHNVEPSTLYGYRWPGSFHLWDAYLAAVRLVCDVHPLGGTAASYLARNEQIASALRLEMRRRRRRGFTLKQYKSWRSAP